MKKNLKKGGGFTLVEIMIVVAIIALLASIATPSFIRARKRSQATAMLDDLRLIDSAIGQYAVESGKVAGDTVDWTTIKQYLKPNSAIYSTGRSVIGGDYSGVVFKVDVAIETPSGTGAALRDVADTPFWSPFVLID